MIISGQLLIKYDELLQIYDPLNQFNFEVFKDIWQPSVI